MAKAPPRKIEPAKTPGPEAKGWVALTWDDLEQWAGGRTVERGRAYQRGGHVTDLKVSEAGELLATVRGTERYATSVSLIVGGKRPTPDSICSCPVGSRCKHAVAVIADYLKGVSEGRDVPRADQDDPRWSELARDASGHDDDDWEEDEEDEDDDDDDDRESDPPPKPRRAGTSAAGREPSETVKNDARIEKHLRAKSQSELADLALSLVRRFPEIRREFSERIALQEGDTGRLVAEARREIRKVTSEHAWRNHWDGEGHTPDYSPIKHRFERLLELGHADEVVSLGREFLKEGLRQVGEANDEGETSNAFAECLPVVFQAVTRSSLSAPERLLFVIDAELAEDYETIGESSDVVYEAPATPEDWSVVADTLAGRLEPVQGRGKPGVPDYSRDFARDHLTNRIADALERAGRDGELRALYESEARATGSYDRLVRFLLELKEFDEAERWANEGIDELAERQRGTASGLAARLRELAETRKQWDVVAAHLAHAFFSDYPSASTFEELMKGARKAKVEGPVRAAALHFLETGVKPYEVIPSTAAGPRPKTPARGHAVAKPSPQKSTARVKVDPSWPLPVPDSLIALSARSSPYGQTSRPHLDVLLRMAIDAKRPDDVLRWYDTMRADAKRGGSPNAALSHADSVAEAVSAAYPERTLEIYQAALNAQLPHAHVSSYESAAGYLKKLRPVYKSLGRAAEWTALVASIREQYRNRPRLMEILDGLDDRTIVQTERGRTR